MQNVGLTKRFVVVLAVLMGLSLSQEKSFAAKCPCDIYKDGGTPCVAAHSTTRALYSSYNGPLYQVKRTADNKTQDIGLLTAGGFVNATMQDTFLNGKPGTVSIIYDQSPNGNHLARSPKGGWLKVQAHEVNATAAKIKINGFTAYGIYTFGNGYSSVDTVVGAGYRIDKTIGVVTGNGAEGIYGVFGGKHVSWGCCFDYGNVQTNNQDNGNASMETIYFGTSNQWGHGSGNGPWVMNDCENGIQAGVDPNGTKGVWNGNTSIIADYVTGIVKSDTSNFFAIRGGDATKDTVKNMYRGRQYPGWYPKKLEGAIALGVGGDNSNTGEGTFFEGALTKGMPSDTTENAVQKNIIAAGYGSSTTEVNYEAAPAASGDCLFSVNYTKANGTAVVEMTLPPAALRGELTVRVYDLIGRLAATPFMGRPATSRLAFALDSKQARSGAYFVKVSLDNKTAFTKTITLW